MLRSYWSAMVPRGSGTFSSSYGKRNGIWLTLRVRGLLEEFCCSWRTFLTRSVKFIAWSSEIAELIKSSTAYLFFLPLRFVLGFLPLADD